MCEMSRTGESVEKGTWGRGSMGLLCGAARKFSAWIVMVAAQLREHTQGHGIAYFEG